ncbi:MAG: MBL fold metallo-hydrolase, partial [Saprospiraceae bacterium]
TAGDTNILIDAGPDLRQQMLRAQVHHLDAILLTHEHNDHVIGLDDIRPFNFRSGQPMTIYALPRVATDVRKRFEYVFGEPIPGLPRIALVPLHEHTPLRIGDVDIQPIGVQHGRLPILGFRFGDLTYLTDVKTVDDLEFEKIKGTQHLVLNALHHEEHHAHLNLREALAFIERVKPQQAWLTHVSHRMGLARFQGPKLPAGVGLAFDGLEIEF